MSYCGVLALAAAFLSTLAACEFHGALALLTFVVWVALFSFFSPQRGFLVRGLLEHSELPVWVWDIPLAELYFVHFSH